MSQVPSPFDPIKIGPITLRNRFVRSGANEAMTVDGAPSKALVKHHGDVAAGGVGMTTVAYGAVSKVGRTLANQLVLQKENLPDLRVLADAIHAGGAKASMQITHGGSFVTSLKLDQRAMSASGGINKAGLFAGNYLRRAMNEADMRQVIQEFVQAAKLCREAGFDVAEIHMGHGYLLNQFISPLDNKRTDVYGGNAVNRVRFPARLLAAVKDAVGKDMAVIAKINVSDGVPKGATAEDGVVTARALEQAGADMLVLSGGRNVDSPWYIFGGNLNQKAMEEVMAQKKFSLGAMAFKLAGLGAPKIDFHEMYFLEHSRKIRAAVRLPLAFLGGVHSMASVEKAMAEGFDCVVMARPLIHDPDLVNKFRSGALTRSGCTACNSCVAYIYHPAGVRCVLNPPNDLLLNQRRASEQ
ncbi:NADH:flavin oxidoreductase [Paraburkholderia sp. HP33-1]|uniref:NADH:flavin oxidoreductase n=1 Tax=Paraburkholderia sp. HP33-1 TaxID=2883243 RepID=UPI001F2A0F3C|nr:NADH:flavin oxidoreductase [Paraburkholderia sp. HP33-1]